MRSSYIEMFNPCAFAVRRADDSDEPALAWLATLDSQPPLRRPALIGYIDGMPAAAISLADGRVVADPFQPSLELTSHLRLYRSGWRATEHRASVAARVRSAIAHAARA